jgi:putative transcriptional regulator
MYPLSLAFSDCQLRGPITHAKQLHMTQTEFAKALRILLATLRNWEQGRVLPDPAARSLLAIVASNPRAAF